MLILKFLDNKQEKVLNIVRINNYKETDSWLELLDEITKKMDNDDFALLEKNSFNTIYYVPYSEVDGRVKFNVSLRNENIAHIRHYCENDKGEIVLYAIPGGKGGGRTIHDIVKTLIKSYTLINEIYGSHPILADGLKGLMAFVISNNALKKINRVDILDFENYLRSKKYWTKEEISIRFPDDLIKEIEDILSLFNFVYEKETKLFKKNLNKIVDSSVYNGLLIYDLFEIVLNFVIHHEELEKGYMTEDVFFRIINRNLIN